MKTEENSVTIVITPFDYTTTIVINGKKFTENWKATGSGSEKVSGDFENEKSIPDSLWEELDVLSNYRVMKALNELL